eukprot:s945_g12.t1
MGDSDSSKRPRVDGDQHDLSRVYERALAEASMQLRGQTALRLPWEKGIYAEIFSGSELPKMPSLPVPAVLPAGDVTRPGDSREKVLKRSSDPLQKFDRAVFKQCIKKSTVEAGGRSNTDREAVYRRWLCVIGHNLAGSQLGKIISEGAGEPLQLISEALEGKSTSTLLKRVRFVARMLTWAAERSYTFFPLRLDLVLEFMRTLGTYSGKSQCGETINFLIHVVGIHSEPDILKHPVIKGLLRGSQMTGMDVKQSRVLTVSEVLALEDLLGDESLDPVDRYGAGVFLFQIYSRARVSDIRNIQRFDVDLEGNDGYLEVKTMDHKNAKKGRGEAVSASETTDWLRGLLSRALGDSFKEGLTSHGLKATTLSWLTKAGFSDKTCLILGHHSRGKKKSLYTYGRDVQARPLRELQECIGLIKRHVFHPDSTRSGMFKSVEQSEQVASGSDALEDAAKQFIAAVPAETPMELGTFGEDESKQSDLDAIAGYDEGGEHQAASSESGSSTTSSSGSSDEAVDAYESFSDGRVLDKVIPPLGVEVDLDVFQNPKTRSLHTRAKGHFDLSFGTGQWRLRSLADMAVPLTESKAVFTERCELAGLPVATRDVLVGKNLNTLASLAFAAGQPGETPTDAALTSLARAGDEEVPIATLASLRRLVFEAQLLMTAQVKQLIEQRSDDQKAELAPAERTERIKRQAERLSGVALRNETECSHGSYDLVMRMVQENTISYLSPARFPSRQAELKLEKPKKELDVVNSKITLKDQVVDLQCQLSTPLCLHHALHRRALAMDLVGICSYHVIMEFHEYLMSHLTVEPPPGYNHVTIHQVLSADRAAWLRLAEKLPKGLRAGADGKLPLDLELPLLQGDPKVAFHLLPLGSSASPSGGKRPHEETPVFTRFLHQQCPDAVFTSLALLKNIQTRMHIDPNNSLPYLNTVAKVSEFKGGELWVCSDHGTDLCPDPEFQHLKGLKIPFEGDVIRFDSHLRHCTYPWSQGPRVVLVGFVVKGPELMPANLCENLVSLGFRMPLEAAPQTNHSSSPAGPEESPWHRVVVGIPWTPDEFISRALAAKHPKHLFTGLPPELQATLDILTSKSPAEIGATRTEQLRKWVGRVQELAPVEQAIKQRMTDNCAKILRSKRLAVFKELLEASGHKDETIVADIAEGFKLSGPIPASGVYRPKRTSATLTTAALRRSAHVLRRGIVHSTKGSGDAELDRATIEATRDELKRGWLFGPVSETDLPDDAVVTRRFGIRQGGKCRPIDNYLESGVNATTSASDTITVHSADVLAAALSYRIHKLRSIRRSSKLVARAWDLSKAYKNLALHPDSVSDAFLAVWNPDTMCTEIYGQLVLPFGARSSVHSFCRTSLGIWIIGVHVFLLHWGVYFDDFVGSEEPCLARLFELCADGLFALLGWATSSDKASEFDTIAQVLGLKINLGEAALGFIYFENTEHRRDHLVATLNDIIDSSFLSRKDGERLRGRLQFAEQQISGKRAGLAFRELSKHVASGGGRLDPGTLSALLFLKEHVASAPARCIADRSCYTWHLYVDASNDDSKSGIGGILIAETGSYIGHFSEYLDETTLADLNTSGSENPIFELECFAIWCGICSWARLFRHCHLIIFTDNDGALHSMINGRSENDSGGRIVSATHNLLDEHFVHPWFERVNTSSNIADFPSRGISKQEWGIRVSLDFQRLARVARTGGDVPSSEPSAM